MKKVIIMHETVTSHDAIGNDIERMYFILIEQGYECLVYAENRLNKNLNYVEYDKVEEILADGESLVIYHHSVNWEKGYWMLKKSRCNIIIRYHNITPPEFFDKYNEDYYFTCKNGRELTVKLAEEFKKAIWLVDSKYNSEDINEFVKKDNIIVLPPFHKIEEWSKCTPDENILEELLYSEDVNILFVGRVAPNKGYLFLLDVLLFYCKTFDKKIKLRCIGKFDKSLEKYNNLIKRKIKEYKLTKNIEFIGEVNDSTLMSYYLGSDVFVCASEHEGFCVPIIEAQFFQIPIIARKLCAVPETIGANQLLFDDNPKEYAAAIKLLRDNSKYKEYLANNGRKNFDDNFAINIIKADFLNLIDKFNH